MDTSKEKRGIFGFLGFFDPSPSTGEGIFWFYERSGGANCEPFFGTWLYLADFVLPTYLIETMGG